MVSAGSAAAFAEVTSYLVACNSMAACCTSGLRSTIWEGIPAYTTSGSNLLSVLQAEFELNDTKKDVLVALVQLYRSLGGGWQ